MCVCVCEREREKPMREISNSKILFFFYLDKPLLASKNLFITTRSAKVIDFTLNYTII